MSFWRYCSCEPYGPNGGQKMLDFPTAEEKIAGELTCDYCGQAHAIDEDERTRLMVEMHEDIQTLKKTVDVLTRAVKALALKAA